MTSEEYYSTDWERGNMVRLTNGKEYPVKKPKKHVLLLYSAEYEAYFVANYKIIECRTSDNVEPYPEKKSAHNEKSAHNAHQESAAVTEVTPAETIPTVEATPAPVSEAKPKRKRQRITVKGTSVEKIVF